MGESIAEYIAELRHIAEHCEYGSILDDMLRDRLVCGVADDRIQRRLLAETELSFAKAMQLATAMELADRDTADLRSVTKDTVNATTHWDGRQGKSGRDHPRSQEGRRCDRCARPDSHRPSRVSGKEHGVLFVWEGRTPFASMSLEIV